MARKNIKERKNKTSEFDANSFLKIIENFIEQCDKGMKNSRTTKGLKPSKIRDELNEILAEFDYVSHISFGIANIANQPSICFAPTRTLSENLVNGKKLQLNRGVYICLGYIMQKSSLSLTIGYSDKNPPQCKMAKLVAQKRQNFDENAESKEWEYYYLLSEYKEKLIKDFLHLINEFDKIPNENFKPLS